MYIDITDIPRFSYQETPAGAYTYCAYIYIYLCTYVYGMAMIARLLEMRGLFCRI